MEHGTHGGKHRAAFAMGIFKRTSLTDHDLSSISQAGLVNNLNDGMAWGLYPLLYAATGLALADIGWLAAIYPAVWCLGQLFTGTLSDRIGRKWLIAAGMWVQAAGIAVTAVSTVFAGFATGTVVLGIGTAMVYPTLLAAIGDVAHPAWAQDLSVSIVCGGTSATQLERSWPASPPTSWVAGLDWIDRWVNVPVRFRCRPADARNEAIAIGVFGTGNFRTIRTVSPVAENVAELSRLESLLKRAVLQFTWKQRDLRKQKK
jgi:hypothetical protein